MIPILSLSHLEITMLHRQTINRLRNTDHTRNTDRPTAVGQKTTNRKKTSRRRNLAHLMMMTDLKRQEAMEEGHFQENNSDTIFSKE